MKKLFGLIILLGFFFISCGNAFHIQASRGDSVDVTLQIPTEVLASISGRAAADSSSNSLEVSLFVNDDEPIKKTSTNFSKTASISFKKIAIGSTVKAQANLVYQGKKYFGESDSVIVKTRGTNLQLKLKSSDSQDSEDLDVFLEGISGEIKINESKLIFSPWHYEEESTADCRYLTTVSLESILGDKHLSDGDTLVFVLTSEQDENNIFSENAVRQFYYQLQEENWQSKDDTVLYQNNNCINFEQPELTSGKRNYYFVMPLNLIKNPKDYKNIQFFFDVPKSAGTPGDLELECSVSYTILPASQKAFVFGVGKNWGGTPAYRYEFNLPLEVNNQKCEFNEDGGETVEVTLSGNVLLYKKNESGFEKTNFSTGDYSLAGEIYDGAGYNSSENTEWYSFHPLSNDQGVNNKNLYVTDGVFVSGSTYRFGSIQKPFFDLQAGVNLPPDFSHDYKIQCTTPCVNPSDILLIQNFGMVTTVTPGN